jgi:hypothetical protein
MRRLSLAGLASFAGLLVACGESEPRNNALGQDSGSCAGSRCNRSDAGSSPGAGCDGGSDTDAGSFTGPSCDGGSECDPPQGPAAPILDLTVLGLYQSAQVHAFVASPFHFGRSDDDDLVFGVWTSGSCKVWGTLQASLDGAPALPMLPTGSHTYEVTFADCMGGDPMAGVWWDGALSAAYVSADLNDLTALVSANSMTFACCGGSGWYMTADGSGTWTRVRTSTARTLIYTPTIGATLINNHTAHVATFGGGSYSSSFSPPVGNASSGREVFDNLTVAVGATSYILHGRIESGAGTGYSGEVRITSNGTLVARLYGDRGALRTEVLSPLDPF